MSDFVVFENRLRKNHKHWSKWARRNGIMAYRLYDRDVPEFPFIVDLYGQRAHLQEVDTGWQLDENDYLQWLASARQSVATVLGLGLEAVSLKQRRRQRGVSQYEMTGNDGEDFVVEEGGHRFIVNLDRYLDTGLFLDHRPTRARVQLEAPGKRFLNLFAYTGSFSVYAARGGATHSVTVDMSNTYQDWTKRNFELNGIDLARHQLVRADVFRYLDEAVDQGDQFDLIVMDPPSFSNSAKMQDILDIQRDHSHLIRQSMKLLGKDGVLYFSNNLRTFKLDQALFSDFFCTEITDFSIPEDFRNKRIHRCWRITQP
ncbi:23S rRNA (cytosine1962-C5)-methyltransferase [Chitinivorax tropicus]|uniref:23S rRNA (Cytosine1962-C5)-methyltransferase n=1 Tax=Chitinivorax tropicus TaxID=714531 RepID=A0A840ML80_9PROT|nr:class I SAM-dependent methyltransferase [Chitinivorax tropicus]MBB5018255.1 23S rRNA (cytosine1962-C5)-methyltransferase [Chitinivorax tropicus]